MGLMSPIIKEYIKREAGDSQEPLLDIGCGDLPYRDLFPHIKSYFATDYDEVRYQSSVHKDVKFTKSDVTKLPFGDNTFNTVLATQLIEHLVEPEALFHHIFRVLKVGGKAIITFPLVSPLHEEPYDYWRFTEHGIGKICAKAHLRIEKTVPMGGGWMSVAFIIKSIFAKKILCTKSRIQKYLLPRIDGFIFSRLIRLDRRWLYPEMPWNYLIVVRKIVDDNSK